MIYECFCDKLDVLKVVSIFFIKKIRGKIKLNDVLRYVEMILIEVY